jgi:hypothetical protein
MAKSRPGGIVRNRYIIIGILIATAALAVLISRQMSRSAGDIVANTTRITFTELGFDQPDKSFAVIEPAEVQRIIGTIRLRSKRPCSCGVHLHQATFQKPSGQVQVSFCIHCFDVLAANGSYEGAKLYKMPKEFYAEFCRLADSQTNEEWITTRSVR